MSSTSLISAVCGPLPAAPLQIICGKCLHMFRFVYLPLQTPDGHEIATILSSTSSDNSSLGSDPHMHPLVALLSSAGPANAEQDEDDFSQFRSPDGTDTFKPNAATIGRMALVVAAHQGDEALCQQLLDAKASPDAV